MVMLGIAGLEERDILEKLKGVGRVEYEHAILQYPQIRLASLDGGLFW